MKTSVTRVLQNANSVTWCLDRCRIGSSRSMMMILQKYTCIYSSQFLSCWRVNVRLQETLHVYCLSGQFPIATTSLFTLRFRWKENREGLYSNRILKDTRLGAQHSALSLSLAGRYSEQVLDSISPLSFPFFHKVPASLNRPLIQYRAAVGTILANVHQQITHRFPIDIVI